MSRDDKLPPGQHAMKLISVEAGPDGTLVQTFELENGSQVKLRTRPNAVEGMLRIVEARVASLEAHLGITEPVERGFDRNPPPEIREQKGLFQFESDAEENYFVCFDGTRTRIPERILTALKKLVW